MLYVWVYKRYHIQQSDIQHNDNQHIEAQNRHAQQNDIQFKDDKNARMPIAIMLCIVEYRFDECRSATMYLQTLDRIDKITCEKITKKTINVLRKKL